MVADSGKEETGADISEIENAERARLALEIPGLGILEPEVTDPTYLKHRIWMMRSLALAHTAGQTGEVPVAAIVVGPDNQLIAQAANRKERDQDPTAHAEVLALRAAGKRLGNWHLNECVLYVTLEPCMMCAGAIIQSRLGLLVYGADDIKAGAVRSVLNLPDSLCSNHKLPVIGGILEAPCRTQLQDWFRQKRQQKTG
ncbi:MAG: tRNA adenosine(34) deaminase TadA [Cyanobacteria bacterium P01_D01_bin.36]